PVNAPCSSLPPFSLQSSDHHRALHSFPTRRSSDLPDYPKHTQVLDYLKSYAGHHQLESAIQFAAEVQNIEPSEHSAQDTVGGQTDRKSTRLNSSHVKISYAVFCLKKKKKKETVIRT